MMKQGRVVKTVMLMKSTGVNESSVFQLFFPLNSTLFLSFISRLPCFFCFFFLFMSTPVRVLE